MSSLSFLYCTCCTQIIRLTLGNWNGVWERCCGKKRCRCSCSLPPDPIVGAGADAAFVLSLNDDDDDHDHDGGGRYYGARFEN